MTDNEQAQADLEYDRLREEGYRSPEQKRIVEEMEAKETWKN